MKKTFFALTSICLLGAVLPGCKVVVDDVSYTYESCGSTSDCYDAFDECLNITGSLGSGNICTQSCSFDSDCPGFGVCVDGGVCLDTCSGDFDCIGGWSCQGSVCLPDGGGPIGTADSYQDCSTDDDCIDGADFCTEITNDGGTREMCTRSCEDHSDCPGGDSLCVDFGNGGVCFDGCSAGSCEGGYGCYEPSRSVLICLPGAGEDIGIPAYDECFEIGSNPGDCSSWTGGCFQIATSSASAGVCTSLCDSSDECPYDSRNVQGLCIGFPGQPTTCFEQCSGDGDCASGFSCKPIETGGDTVCLPT